MHGAVAPVVQVAASEQDARLGLVEFLQRTDLQASARRVVDWLVAQTRIRHAVIALAEPSSSQLLIVAEHGVSSAAIVDFVLTHEDEAHPLIKRCTARGPATSTASRRSDPLSRGVSTRCRFAWTTRSRRWACCWRARLRPRSGRSLGRDDAVQAGVAPDEPRRSGGDALRTGAMLLLQHHQRGHRPILLTDTEGKLIIANTHAEKLFAAPEDAGEGWRRAVGLNNMLFSAALSTSAMSESELARRELLLVDPLEGSDLLFELLSSRAKDERQGTYVVSVLRNVTDLARAKEEIEESYRTLRVAQAEVRDERHRLELIIDSVADPILVTDQEGDIVLMNEPRAPVQPAGRCRRNDGAAHQRQRCAPDVVRVERHAGEQRYRGEIQLTDPVSGRALVEGVAGTILSEQGELMWVVTILHDMTEAIEKRRLAAQLEIKVQAATAELAQQNELLRRQHIALEQASALKSQFLANMSHEFRTPLNAILGYTHMLLHGVTGPVSEQQRKSLTRIDSNSQHLLALINDILDITRIGGQDAAEPVLLRDSGAGERGEVRARADHQAFVLRVTAKMLRTLRPIRRSPEGEADCSQSAQQCAEVHAGRVRDDRCVV